MRIINCYNYYHLGDCIEALHFLINATKCNNIKFNFLCKSEYHSQLKELIGDDRVDLVNAFDSEELPINTWIGAYDYGQICRDSAILYGKDSDQGTFFLILAQLLSKIMNIECPFTSKEDLIYNQKTLEETCIHEEKYEYLFINSQNMSIPFPNFEQECDNLIQKLKATNKKFITTRKVNNVPCTIDYNLSVIQIAKLSKNVKSIIAVNTGPLHLCMNKWTIANIKHFVIWSPAETFNYGSKFQTVKSLGDIDENYF